MSTKQERGEDEDKEQEDEDEDGNKEDSCIPFRLAFFVSTTVIGFDRINVRQTFQLL